MRRFLLMLPFLTVTACATGPSLQTRMAGYIGASSETLVQGMGVPDKQISINGVQYLAYVRHRTSVSPGYIDGGFGSYGFVGGGFGPYGFGGPDFISPPIVTDWSCETTFLLKDGKVFNFTLRGNDCSR